MSLYTLDRPDRASPLNHVRRYPADGTFVSGNGKVFRFAGGAPIYVASWADVGGQRPATAVSLYTLDRPDRASPLNHVRRYPADGTFVSGNGKVFRFAGGAPIYVASWADVGGQRPATAVSLYTLDRPDRASPLNHVRRYPADGTVLKGAPSGVFWLVKSGKRTRTASSSAAVQVSDAGYAYIPVAASPRTSWTYTSQYSSAEAAWVREGAAYWGQSVSELQKNGVAALAYFAVGGAGSTKSACGQQAKDVRSGVIFDEVDDR